jgi:hypothetical protein
MKQVIAQQDLFLYNDKEPKVKIKIFSPEEKEGVRNFICPYEITVHSTQKVTSMFGVGQNSVAALLSALRFIGTDIEVLNKNEFGGRLREHPSLLEPCEENCGLPVFDPRLGRPVYPKIFD